jgi:hypothetical protein
VLSLVASSCLSLKASEAVLECCNPEQQQRCVSDPSFRE